MRWQRHRWASGVLLVCAMAVSRPARAEDPAGRRRVVVLRFSGAQASRVHSAVVSGLRRQAVVVDEDQFGEVLSSAEGPTRPDRIAAACRELRVDAAVEGMMRRAGRAWSVEVFVRDCANGEKILPAGRATYSMRNLGGVSAIRGTIWARIGEAILAATGTSGGGSAVASAPRPSPPSRAAPRPTPSRAAAAPPTRSASATASADRPCIFNEDEPPEGFPGYGNWVRRRNDFLNRCEEAKRQRAADLVRQRQEAERRARAEAQERARRATEEERRRREAQDRARRAEEQRARREADDRRQAIEQARRREEESRLAERRRRDEETRLAERRRRDEESRAAAARRRREEEEASAAARRYRDEPDDPPPRERRRDDRDIEREVAAYRARLERERLAALDRPDYDDRRRSRDEEPPTSDDADRRWSSAGDYDDPPVDRPRSRDEDEQEPWDRDRDRDPDDEPAYDSDPDRDRDLGRDPDDIGRDEELARVRGGDEPEREHASATAQASLPPTVLHLGAGIGFVNRQMTVEVEGSAKPRSYTAPGYPELAVEARFFPAALTKNPGAIGGLGAFGIFRRHLFLQTSGIDVDTSQPIDIPTGEQELAGGVVFRTPMGSTPKSPIFEISLGYGYFQFLLGPDAMAKLDSSMQMPTMTYVNVIGNAGIAVPLDDRGLAVELSGTYRYVLDVGQAARDLFGAKTTGGYALGGRAALGGEAAFVARGIFWSLSAEALIFNTEFSGASSYGDGYIGGFPSGSDRYLRGTAVVGYRFR